MISPSWINLIVGLLAAATTAALFVAGIRGEVRALETQVADLKAEMREAYRELRTSRDKLGERLGEIERRVAVDAALQGRLINADQG